MTDSEASTHRALSSNTGLEVSTLQYRTMQRHIHAHLHKAKCLGLTICICDQLLQK